MGRAYTDNLLRMAAKAAGIVIVRSRLDDPMHTDMLIRGSARSKDRIGPWNPIDDDGDALRLAAAVRQVVHIWQDGSQVSVARTLPDGEDPPADSAEWNSAVVSPDAVLDVAAAARLAIVLNAAAAGRAMP